MKKGKSNYNLTFNSDSTLVNNIVQSYLKESGFNMYEKKGEKYYRAGDAMLGYKGFNYSINGNNLIIEASTDDKTDKLPTRKERHSTAPFPIQINQAGPMTKNPSVPSLPLLTIPAEATEAPALPVFLQVLLLPLFSRKKAPAHI